ncbi:hypothetical protein BSKO_07395 [Bryopsis sp. KO-2023]|nr:hypothetical protein BSKO_07395 [Bryopsis sp. KO-2023]
MMRGAGLARVVWNDVASEAFPVFKFSQLVSLSRLDLNSNRPSPQNSHHWMDFRQRRNMAGVVERTEAPFLSVDEAPYRLREALYNRALWKESFLTGPDHVFQNLSEAFKPLQLWQNMFSHMIGAHNAKKMLETRKGRARFETEIPAIRDAVVNGEFQWLGKGGLFVQGDIRKGLEPRIIRSDMKEMEELVEKEARREKKLLVDPGKKLALDAYFQDRLVIEIMRVVLEPVFETQFSPRSHGFRPGRTQITSLKQVGRDHREALWFWRGDTRGIFDFCIQDRGQFKSRMLELVGKRVGDAKFLNLLDEGIANWAIFSKEEVLYEPGYSPLNVKSGIMPLLCNIYFHPLDAWIEERIPEFHQGRTRRVNPERAALILQGNIRDARKAPMYDPFDPNFTRLAYCRFSDDFLLGVAGSKHLFHSITNDFRAFAEESLGFPLPAVELKHIRKKIPFLGHVLRMRGVSDRKRPPEHDKVDVKDLDKLVEILGTKFGDPMEAKQVTAIAMKDSHTIKAVQRQSSRFIFGVDGDSDKIIRLLARAGYCHKNGDPIPNFKHMHFPQSDTNLIIRKILLSICDFYQVARNRQRLVNYCGYVMRHSIAKMYAAKFKLRSRAKVFKRSGRWLDKRIKVGKGFIGKIDPETGERSKEEYVQIPYARISEVPKPDFTVMTEDWEPPMITELRLRALRSPSRSYREWGDEADGKQLERGSWNYGGNEVRRVNGGGDSEGGEMLGPIHRGVPSDTQPGIVREEWGNEGGGEKVHSG